MNPSDETAERIWQTTVSLVRSTKSRRRNRRMAACGVAGAIAIACFSLSYPTLPERQVTGKVEVRAPVATLVVMKISENGGVRLEELSPSELGSMELAFGLAPTIMDGTVDW